MCHHECAAIGALSKTSRPVEEAAKFTLATVSVSEWWIFLKDAIVLQYVGFENKGAVREYTFTVCGTGGACSEYFPTITNDTCVAHARNQNALDICSLQLHREFASQTGRPASTRFWVTDTELADYKADHALKTKPGPLRREKTPSLDVAHLIQFQRA